MGACQNEFQNVPDIQVDSRAIQQYQKERQKERFTSKSIKLPHKTLKPNSRQVKIGMINSNIQGAGYRQTMPASKYAMNRTQYMKSHMSYNDKAYSQQQKNLQLQSDLESQQIDREELHQTVRPFGQDQYIQVPDEQGIAPKADQKQHKQLTLDFFYSLGLPQYTYPPIPETYAEQYKSQIQIREQQERNGVKYIGEWKNSHIHGNGVLKSNTLKYIGQFRNGLKNFHGRQIEREQVYQGGFWGGRRKGQGIRYTPTSTEEGEFDEYLIKGKITYENGDIYEGELKNHQYHGKGKLWEKDNELLHQGNFKFGKLHGTGQIKFSDGKKYEGQFQNGLKHGYGRFQWDDQNKYEGQYMKGKKHGKGKLLRNGMTYEGTFKNGTMNGKMQVYREKDGRRTNERFEQYENGMKITSNQQSFMSQSEDLPENWRNAVMMGPSDQ